MKKNGKDQIEAAGPMRKAEVIYEGAGAGHLSDATEDTNENGEDKVEAARDV